MYGTMQTVQYKYNTIQHNTMQCRNKTIESKLVGRGKGGDAGTGSRRTKFLGAGVHTFDFAIPTHPDLLVHLLVSSGGTRGPQQRGSHVLRPPPPAILTFVAAESI